MSAERAATVDYLAAQLLRAGGQELPRDAGGERIIVSRRWGALRCCALVPGDGITPQGAGRVVDNIFETVLRLQSQSDYYQPTGFVLKVKGIWTTIVFVFRDPPDGPLRRFLRRLRRMERTYPQGRSTTLVAAQASCWMAIEAGSRVIGNRFPPFVIGRYPGRRRLQRWLANAPSDMSCDS